MSTKRGFNVSFPKSELYILDYINAQPNPSAFVRRAVEFFMTGGGSYPPAPLNFQLVPFNTQYYHPPINPNNGQNINGQNTNGQNDDDQKDDVEEASKEEPETKESSDNFEEANNEEEQKEKATLNTKVKFKKANEIVIDEEDIEDYGF